MKTDRVKVRVTHVDLSTERFDAVTAVTPRVASQIATIMTTGVQGIPPLAINLWFLPKSLNHQYVRRGKGQQYDLDPEIKALRDEMYAKLAPIRGRWAPTGLLGAVIVFASPSWLTKEHTIRSVDTDNKVKPLLDAFEKATGINDARFWETHVFKAYSNVTCTTLFVYDLGDIVQRHSFRE